MKSPLFARPDLKLFLFGAVLLLCIQHLLTSGFSQPARGQANLPVSARVDAKDEFRQLLAEATLRPSSRSCMRLCLYYEKRGDYRKALYWLRRADALAQMEDLAE